MSAVETEDAASTLTTAGLSLQPASDLDRDPLLSFLLAEFGGEWWHDIGWFLDAGGDPAEVLLLRGDGRIQGFARVHTPASRPPGWPMYWHTDSPSAGGLGPIGLAAALRGRGLGRALLVLALDHLRSLGHADVVIDDTTLLGYYGPHGFAPWITYRHATAPLGPILAAAD
jgi:GNAT superfamily N-acetyltransferase